MMIVTIMINNIHNFSVFSHAAFVTKGGQSMNDALAAVVSQSQSKKVSTSSKARQYKSSAPRTWLEWTPSQKSLCVQLFLEGNYNHVVLHYG